MGKQRGASGFTLIEAVIVLAILAVIIGMLAPMAIQFLTAERASALEEELQAIYTAIVGNPEKGVFGYVGDVGNYPASILDLIRQPVDANGAPLKGWKGPYLQNPRLENSVWLDPTGRPYEYYLVNGGDVPDQLALLSRGADGLSTNTSTTPNVASTYAGLAPTDSGYPNGTNNGDNVLFPRVEGNTNALNLKTDGDVAFNILNWDNNKEVNTFVPACPELYKLTATSVARGTVEADVKYVQGLSFNLAQGQYRVSISPQGLTTTSWSETITVMPGATLTRTLNLTGLDSSGTPQFNLTVKNGFTTTELEVFQFDTKLSGTLPGQTSGSKSYINEGETRVFAVRGCSQVYVRKKGKSDVVDQFVMPYGHFTRQEGTSAATLIVKNLHGHDHHDHGNGHWHHHHDHHHHHHHGHHRVFVYRNDILLGTVNHHQTKTFKDLLAGDTITIKDKDGTVLLSSLVLVVGTNSVTLGS
jgi:hypothetical protein